MKSHRVGDGERSLAVFIDFENIALGFQNGRDKFDIHKVLERLVEKGKIVAKKAYADWSRFSSYTTGLHEAAIELVEIPRRGMSGKNSADIRLVVDAMDLAYSKDHIDTFVIVSGDSDFSPLVSKLKELGKHVIGLGLADATSDLLRDNCDEFIYYEDLDRAPIIPVSLNEQIPEKKRKAFALMLESLLALRRENKEVIYSSMLKDTIKRKKPSFNEEYYGYRTFSELLEDAQRYGLLEIEKHKSSGMYVVTRFGLEMKGGGSGAMPQARNGSRRSGEAARPTSVVRPGERPMETTGGRAAGAVPGRVADPPADPAADPAAGRATAAPTSGRVVEPVSVKAAGGERAVEASPARPAQPTKKTLTSTSSSSARMPDEPALPLERPLGRALVEDFDDLGDLDEPPDRSEAAQAPPPTRKSAAATRKPTVGSQPPPPSPAQSGVGVTAAASSSARQPTEGSTRQRSRRSDQSAHPSRARPPTDAELASGLPRPSPPSPQPAPRAAQESTIREDDEFSAGLE